MLLLKAENLKKIYGERTVLTVPELTVYTGDRIGVVGANGAGKSTLFQILAEKLEPESGKVTRYGEISYCRQFEDGGAGVPEFMRAQRAPSRSAGQQGTREWLNTSEAAQEISRWKVPRREAGENMSGGEEMRRKLAEAFAEEGHILLLDEPTANLDSEGVRQLIGQLKRAETFLCISHDRELLTEACTAILEVADGKVRMYPGNFAVYEEQKQAEREKAERDYEEYVDEKHRLTAVYRQKRESAERMVKRPNGMTAKEAGLRDFLARRSSDVKQKRMNQAAANVKKRLEHMEVKEKPRQEAVMRLAFDKTDPPESKRVIEVKELSFSYDMRMSAESRDVDSGAVSGVAGDIADHAANDSITTQLLDKVSFSVSNRKKTALLGANGAGKTTLFRLIEEAWRESMGESRDKAGYDTDGGNAGTTGLSGVNADNAGLKGVGQIRLVPKARLGVLAQDFSQIQPEKTVLENALWDSVQQPAVVKNVLAGMLFGADQWNKRAEVLSGGERMRLAFVKLLVSAANVLLLDEPTNYLDLTSIQALERQLAEYEGAVLFISHDREFVRRSADELLLLENGKVTKFAGTLTEYEEAQKRKAEKEAEKQTAEAGGLTEAERMQLELRRAKLSGLFGHAPSLEEKERLEAEYWEITRKLNLH